MRVRLHHALSCLQGVASDDLCTSVIAEEQNLNQEHKLYLNELFSVS